MDENEANAMNKNDAAVTSIELQPKIMVQNASSQTSVHCGIEDSPGDVTKTSEGLVTSNRPSLKGRNVLNKADCTSDQSLSVLTSPVIESMVRQLSSSLPTLPVPNDKFSKFVDRTQIGVQKCWVRHVHLIKCVVKSVLFILYLVYLGFAIRHNVYDSLFLVIMTSLFIIYTIYDRFIKSKCTNFSIPICTATWWREKKKFKQILKWWVPKSEQLNTKVTLRHFRKCMYSMAHTMATALCHYKSTAIFIIMHAGKYVWVFSATGKLPLIFVLFL